MAKAPVTVVIEGKKELIKSLRAVDKDLPKALGPIHKRLGEPIASYAASHAPRRSGRLAGNIRALGSQRAATIAAGKKLIPYAGVIHWGWARRNIEPQTFLTDAIEALREPTADDYLDELNRFLDEVWRTI